MANRVRGRTTQRILPRSENSGRRMVQFQIYTFDTYQQQLKVKDTIDEEIIPFAGKYQIKQFTRERPKSEKLKNLCES